MNRIREIERPRTDVRGFLKGKLRLSDSVGTHSIHGLTSGDLRWYFKTKKSSISRIENHAEDIKLSTLERVAIALGKRLQITLT
jgi:hypothetical protein